MKKTMLFLAFLAFIHTQVFADEELGRLLTDFLKRIPGRSALWTETFRPSYGWDAGYPFFSPAIVRIGASEEYDLVQSSLFLLNWDAYTITYFFEALPPDDQLSLEVVPASGVDVTYQLNVPARFPQSEIYDRIHRAERIVREYTRLESMNRGAAVVVFYLGTGLLTGAGLVWMATNGPGSYSKPEAFGLGVLCAAYTPLALWMAIDSMFSDDAHGRRMKQIREDLRTLWQ